MNTDDIRKLYEIIEEDPLFALIIVVVGLAVFGLIEFVKEIGKAAAKWLLRRKSSEEESEESRKAASAQPDTQPRVRSKPFQKRKWLWVLMLSCVVLAVALIAWNLDQVRKIYCEFAECFDPSVSDGYVYYEVGKDGGLTSDGQLAPLDGSQLPDFGEVKVGGFLRAQSEVYLRPTPGTEQNYIQILPAGACVKAQQLARELTAKELGNARSGGWLAIERVACFLHDGSNSPDVVIRYQSDRDDGIEAMLTNYLEELGLEVDVSPARVNQQTADWFGRVWYSQKDKATFVHDLAFLLARQGIVVKPHFYRSDETQKVRIWLPPEVR